MKVKPFDKSQVPKKLKKYTLLPDGTKQYAAPQKRENPDPSDSYESEEEETEEESEVEEDSDAELLTEKLDKQIHTTLLAIKLKDPKIYRKENVFIDNRSEEEEEGEEEEEESEDDSEEESEDDSEEESEDESEDEASKKLPYNEEQKVLKAAFLNATKDVDEEELFSTKSTKTNKDNKTKSEKSDSKTDKEKTTKPPLKVTDPKSRWFKVEPSKETSEKLKSIISASVTGEDDFLNTYFSQKIWKQDAKNLPMYKEMPIDGQPDMEEDEEILDEQDKFESKYNFRFQDPKGATIITHARDQTTSLRAKDETRRLRQERRAEAKKLKKAKKEEDLKRVKNAKKAEIYKKLQDIQKVTGDSQVGFGDIDLDADFDPEEWNKNMENVYDEEYYNGQDENEKPVFDDDMEDYEIDEDDEDETDHADATKEYLDKQMEELYKLDYEDIVGGQPIRFEYTSVPESDFGLSASDIINMSDKELSQKVPLKAIATYRDDIADVKWNELKSNVVNKYNNPNKFDPRKLNQNVLKPHDSKGNKNFKYNSYKNDKQSDFKKPKAPQSSSNPKAPQSSSNPKSSEKTENTTSQPALSKSAKRRMRLNKTKESYEAESSKPVLEKRKADDSEKAVKKQKIEK